MLLPRCQRVGWLVFVHHGSRMDHKQLRWQLVRGEPQRGSTGTPGRMVCALDAFSVRLAVLMDEQGLGVRALARRVPCDPALISRYRNGRERPSAKVATRLDELLGAGGQLAALVPRQVPRVPTVGAVGIEPDPDLYDRITKAVADPVRVDRAVVEWLERTLAEHRRAEDTLGAAPLIGLVREQLSAVAAFTRAAPGPLADRLVGLAAEYAQFLAWMCIATRKHAAALAWYDRAGDWAVQAGDANMAATTLSMKAHLAWSTGDPQRCVRMGEAARWHPDRVTSGVRGMAAQMTARGHALAGEAGPAHALLDEAQALIGRAAGRPEDEPPWMYFYGENWFRLQRGMAELHLGNWAAAADLLSAGLAALPESYRRDGAWYAACLAHALAEAGDAEQAHAIVLHHAAGAEVNDYARGEFVTAAQVLTAKGARQAQAIRDVLTGSPVSPP